MSRRIFFLFFCEQSVKEPSWTGNEQEKDVKKGCNCHNAGQNTILSLRASFFSDI
jgi:hypothetical protein